MAGWLADSGGTLLEQAVDSLESLPGVGDLVWVVGGLLVAAVASLAGVLGWRLLVRARAREWVAPRGSQGVVEPLHESPASGFLAAFHAALAENRARDASRALWLWVAWSLSAREVGRFELDLTNREFLDRVRSAAPGWGGAGRLRNLAVTTDEFCYGQRVPDVAEVRACLPVAEELLR